MDDSLCSYCHTGVDMNEEGTRLRCKHVYHVKCFYSIVVNLYTRCIDCDSQQLTIFTADTPKEDNNNKAIKSSINFGDDYDIDTLTANRQVIIKKAQQITGNFGQVTLKSINLAVGANSNPDNNNNSISNVDPNADTGGVLKRLGELVPTIFYEALDISANASASSDTKIKLENITKGSVLGMLRSGLASHLMVEKGNVTPRRIVEEHISIAHMIQYGYFMDDFIVFGLTWNDMLAMGMADPITFVSCFCDTSMTADQFSLSKLKAVWGIDAKAIMMDVCKSKLRIFASMKMPSSTCNVMGFTLNDKAIAKYVRSVDDMLIMQHFTLRDWCAIGMTVNYMRSIGITTLVLTDVLKFDPDNFTEVYNTSSVVLDAPIDTRPHNSDIYKGTSFATDTRLFNTGCVQITENVRSTGYKGGWNEQKTKAPRELIDTQSPFASRP
jgi:hypothetical protein